MDNMGWGSEETGRNQEDRDRFIADHWKAHTFLQASFHVQYASATVQTMDRDGCVRADQTVAIRGQSAFR
jgi:hypothetical protein